MSTKQQLAHGVDKCVACGLCIPQCPTWQITRNEANSPRGRLLLMQQLAHGKNPQEADYYLDACLGCGKCEQVCPSEVEYLDLLATAKNLQPPQTNFAIKCLRKLVLHKHVQHVFNLVFGLARILRFTYLYNLFPPKLNAYIAVLPPAPRRLDLATTPTSKDAVGLFVGCLGYQLDNQATVAAAKLLLATGFEVCLPPQQSCCGAIAKHAGDIHASNNYSQQNQALFDDCAYIATTATGCAAQLNTKLAKVIDAGELICQRLDQLKFTEAKHKKIILHAPCSQASCHGSGTWVEKLLRQIPQLEIVAQIDAVCCGAGGLTHLAHSATSNQLALKIIEGHIQEFNHGTTLVTTNYSCGYFLAREASQLGLKINVVHPLKLASDYLAV